MQIVTLMSLLAIAFHVGSASGARDSIRGVVASCDAARMFQAAGNWYECIQLPDDREAAR